MHFESKDLHRLNFELTGGGKKVKFFGKLLVRQNLQIEDIFLMISFDIDL